MILIVDDDASIRMSLGLILKRAGYKIKGASGAEEALAVVRSSLRSSSPDETVDLILMDMNYSSSTTGQDGLELLMKVKVLMPKVPVILMTAWGSIPLAVEGVKAGAMDFMTKPWDNRDLLSRVHTAMSLCAPREDEAVADEPFEGIIGESPELLKVLDTVRRRKPATNDMPCCGRSSGHPGRLSRSPFQLSARIQRRMVLKK